jgi:hypothetical protein
MTRMRRVLALLAAVGSLAASSAALPSIGAGASGVRTCGYIYASVPYSAHGHGERWRVYLQGAASCETAQATLNAVMHLRAKPHFGRSEAGSYFTYAGWLCPFGLMGVQICELPTRLPAQPPIRARALARDCDVPSPGSPGGCPAHLPAGDL